MRLCMPGEVWLYLASQRLNSDTDVERRILLETLKQQF